MLNLDLKDLMGTKATLKKKYDGILREVNGDREALTKLKEENKQLLQKTINLEMEKQVLTKQYGESQGWAEGLQAKLKDQSSKLECKSKKIK